MFFIPSTKIQEIINDAENLNNQIETINTKEVSFTNDGTKYIGDGR